MLTLEEKKEEIVAQYRLSYDLDIAMLKVGITPEEKKLLLNDQSFMYRIEYQKATIREQIVSTMIDNMQIDDPRISQKAAVDLGNLLWKEKFKGNNEGPKGQVPDSIILVGVTPEGTD